MHRRPFFGIKNDIHGKGDNLNSKDTQDLCDDASGVFSEIGEITATCFDGTHRCKTLFYGTEISTCPDGTYTFQNVSKLGAKTESSYELRRSGGDGSAAIWNHGLVFGDNSKTILGPFLRPESSYELMRFSGNNSGGNFTSGPVFGYDVKTFSGLGNAIMR